MQNMKCSSEIHECPEGLDVCCQFCKLNYAPCEGKCAGCWSESPEYGYDVKIHKPITADLPELPGPTA